MKKILTVFSAICIVSALAFVLCACGASATDTNPKVSASTSVDASHTPSGSTTSTTSDAEAPATSGEPSEIKQSSPSTSPIDESEIESIIIAFKNHLSSDSPEEFAEYVKQLTKLSQQEKEALVQAQIDVAGLQEQVTQIIDSLLTDDEKEAMHKMDMGSDAYKSGNAKINNANKNNKELKDLLARMDAASNIINNAMKKLIGN